MIRTVIVDDEKPARENISTFINEYFKSIEIVGEAESVSEAIDVINTYKPELLFLDIDIKGGTGFDVLHGVDYKNTKIIFVTAFQEYAVRAIKFSAFDYILKPFKTSELIQTINKIVEDKIDENYAAKFEAIFSNFNSAYPKLKKMVLKTFDKIHIINIKDIIYCESSNNYTTFFLNSGKKILVSKPIKKYDEMLGDLSFMRVHQSFLVNLNYIQQFDKTEGGMLIMTNSIKIPVSHRQKAALLKFFETL